MTRPRPCTAGTSLRKAECVTPWSEPRRERSVEGAREEQGEERADGREENPHFPDQSLLLE